jgi:hypothetical protein
MTSKKTNYFKKQVEEEKREIKEAEQHQIRLEFSTNIIAAHKYCLRNVIHTGKGFDCEILYLPRHKDPNDDTFFTRIFKVRTLTSSSPIIECEEKRDGWGGQGELYLGVESISENIAQDLVNQAMAIAAALINIPAENDEDQESFFAELEAMAAEYNDDDEVVRQQEHNHELDLAIADLCADVEVEFFEHRML